jgi:hypothetical protein
MFRSLFEKEWIKIKWVLLAYLVISAIAIISIASDLHYSFKIHGAMKSWTNVITYHTFYFSILKFIPIFAGLAISVFQFVPESLNERYRLSFHLPINEKILLLFNLLIGIVAILIINTIITLELFIISSTFYPAEIVNISIISIIPWFLAGLITYLGTSTVICEPNWTQRIFLSITTFYSMNVLTQERFLNQYTQIIGIYIVMIIIYTITILFPGHRLRKGAK